MEAYQTNWSGQHLNGVLSGFWVTTVLGCATEFWDKGAFFGYHRYIIQVLEMKSRTIVDAHKPTELGFFSSRTRL
jgi:hypothetical protein